MRSIICKNCKNLFKGESRTVCHACEQKIRRKNKIKNKIFRRCKDCKKFKIYHSKGRCEACRINMWKKKNPVSFKNIQLKRNKKLKEIRIRLTIEIFNLLNNRCNRCGNKNKIVLQIDHINGGGGKELRRIGSTNNYYLKVLKSIKNKEKKYQLLCANCNWIEAVEKGYKKSIWLKFYENRR